MYTKQIENKLIYGNAEGIPKNQGNCTTEFDEFLKPIMAKKTCIGCGFPGVEKCNDTMCMRCWEQETRDDELSSNEDEF